MVDSQERLGIANDPVARSIGLFVIGAVVLLWIMKRSNITGALSASVNA